MPLCARLRAQSQTGFLSREANRERGRVGENKGIQYTRMDFFRLLLGCVVLAQLGRAEVDGELRRRKRYLIFPQGSNVQLVYCLTIGAYGRDGDLVLGLTAALAWELPSKIDAKLTGLLHRRSRSVVYPKIEAFLQSTGLDGRSCVMRALCEAGQRSASEIGSGTFLQELLHAVFTLREDGSTFDNEDGREYDGARSRGRNRSDCAQLYPSCEHSIYSLDF